MRRALATFMLLAGVTHAQIAPREAFWCQPSVFLALIEAAPVCGWAVEPVVRTRVEAMLEGAVGAVARLRGPEDARQWRQELLREVRHRPELTCQAFDGNGNEVLARLARPAAAAMVETYLADAGRATSMTGRCM